MRFRRSAALAVALFTTFGTLGSAGCAGGSQQMEAVSPVFYPPPPDTARFQFLTAISGSQDIVPSKKQSFLAKVFGSEQQPDDRPILKPYGIATAPGKVYVCDTAIAAIDVIDLGLRTFEYERPLGEGRLGQPLNCLWGVDGRLYVTDAVRNRVAVYGPGLDYLGSFSPGDSARPSGVAVLRDRLLVSDLHTRRVYVYEKASGALLDSMPKVEDGDSVQLGAPANLHVDDGVVYVTDVLLGRVFRFSLSGEFLGEFGSGRGTGFGQFVRPKGISTDRDGRVYIVDSAFENVQVFDRDGRLLTFIGKGGTGPGDLSVPAAIAVDYANLEHFARYVHPEYELQHLLFVTNGDGPNRINVYGFVIRRGGS